MSFLVESSEDSSESSEFPFPLPKELSMNCFALVPRRYYPTLSLVSKTFDKIITSHELYIARRLLKATENVLYVALRLKSQETVRWYALNQKPFKNEYVLAPVPSFPSLPFWGSSVVGIGHEIYVLGGCIDVELTSNVFVYDCWSRTRCFLPSMRVARGCAATGVIDGKIYVIGGCKPRSFDWIEVFDIKKRTWESVLSPCNEEVNEKTIKSFVMDEKIYVMDRSNSFVYDPKEKKWEIETVLNREWRVGSCVIDNVLYTFDGCKNQINVFDLKTKIWSVLRGVEDLPEIDSWSRLANYGGKLAVLISVGTRVTEISCTVIEVERREKEGEEGGEIWGKILSSNRVLTIDDSTTIVQCLTVPI